MADRTSKVTCYCLLALLVACKPGDTGPDICADPITIKNTKPEIFIIGDSISKGYSTFLVDRLRDYTVLTLPHTSTIWCSAESTKKTVKYIDRWLNQRNSFEAIVWNNGIWDISTNKKGTPSTSPQDYRKNLLIIGKKIKQKTDHPLFVLTTNIPAQTKQRYDKDVVYFNNIASKVMRELNIPVVDLHAASEKISYLHVDQSDVHFKEKGYKTLSKSVLSALSESYGIPQKRKNIAHKQ